MELLVITGPPGAGKSAVAERIAAMSATSALVPGDAFFAMLRNGGSPPWSSRAPERNEAVTAAAAAAVGALVRGGLEVVYDGVLGPRFLPQFLRHARLATANYAVLLPDVDTCVQRVRARAAHGFSDQAATRRMHADFVSAALPARHILDTAAMALSDAVIEVLSRRAQGLLAIGATAAGAW